jgi:peptidoglycan/LPS O-acetylase OafA/YrhL
VIKQVTPIELVCPTLTGWRFPLALWVLFYHLNAMIFDLFHPPLVFMDFFQRGYIAVDLFFIISGLVIGHHYGDQLKNFNRKNYLNFLWLRLARVYPLHLAVLLALAVLVLLTYVSSYRISQPQDYTLPLFIANLFLIQAWSFPDHLDWNHPAWAISAEWFIYLLCPLLFRLLWRPWSRLFYMALALLALSFPPLIYLLDQQQGTYALCRIISGFTIGLCLYRILPAHKRAAQKQNFWSNPIWLYLSNLSYAIYMVQFPILLVMRKLWPHQDVMNDILPVKIAYLGLIITIIISTAVLSYHLIEEPARRYLRKNNPFRH